MLRIRLPQRGHRRPTTISLTRGVTTAPVDDGLTLFGVDGTVYHLNATGAAVLAALTGGGVDHAVDVLAARYGLTVERARTDVDVLLADMAKRGLVSGR